MSQFVGWFVSQSEKVFLRATCAYGISIVSTTLPVFTFSKKVVNTHLKVAIWVELHKCEL